MTYEAKNYDALKGAGLVPAESSDGLKCWKGFLRTDYINAFRNNIKWSEVSKRFAQAASTCEMEEQS